MSTAPVVYALGALLVIGGCRRSAPAADERAASRSGPPVAPAAPRAAAAASSSASATGVHGGTIVETSTGAVEILVEHDGRFRCWLGGAAPGAAVPPGTAAWMNLSLAGYPEVVLHPADDHLKGRGPPIPVARVGATLLVRRGTGRMEPGMGWIAVRTSDGGLSD